MSLYGEGLEPRWWWWRRVIASATIVIGLHAGIVAYAYFKPPVEEVVEEAEGAFMLELAPLPVAAAADSAELPGPTAEVTQPQVVEKTPTEEQPEVTPPKEVPLPVATDPELAMPIQFFNPTDDVTPLVVNLSGTCDAVFMSLTEAPLLAFMQAVQLQGGSGDMVLMSQTSGFTEQVAEALPPEVVADLHEAGAVGDREEIALLLHRQVAVVDLVRPHHFHAARLGRVAHRELIEANVVAVEVAKVGDRADHDFVAVHVFCDQHGEA